MRLCSIASGSSGNCIYVGSDATNLLIDTGISGKKVEFGLNSLDLTTKDLNGIFVTHEHSDHIKGLGVIARKCDVPIYATSGTIRAMKESGSLGKLPEGIFHEIQGDSDYQVGDLTIHPFHISHDAAEPVGYRIHQGEHSVGIATDMGVYDEYIVDNLKGLDALLLEGNVENAPPAEDETESADGEAAPQPTAPPAPAGRRDSYILTVDAKDRIETEEERREVIWHEIKTSHIAGRILTGTLDGVEQTPSGRTIVVVDYKGYRIAIPLKEMMLYSGPVPYGAKYKPFMERMNSILATMLTAEIDFIVRGLDNTARSVVASRKAAMLRKRQTFYLDTNEDGVPMIYEGRVVQARVIGVAEKVLRVEVFGVECTIFARDLSAAWFGDAREYYSVGDRVLVRVLTIDRSDINHISITADIRSVSSAANQSNLDKCVLQGKYAGRVTDVRHGVVFIRLNNGVNAVAHTCYDRRMPGKKDDVSFAVTRLDEERGIAVGIITRIIKQNL